jgi:hypothetical protein
MSVRITGFHQDEEGHWVAELSCGHQQHMRHDPPWQNREWVTTAEGRARFIGVEIPCKGCEEIPPIVNVSSHFRR